MPLRDPPQSNVRVVLERLGDGPVGLGQGRLGRLRGLGQRFGKRCDQETVGLLAERERARLAGAAQATYREFRSPSGKLGCAFYSDAETPPMVRCDWRGADDEAIVLRETGRARIRHVTDSVMNPEAKVLRP